MGPGGPESEVVPAQGPPHRARVHSRVLEPVQGLRVRVRVHGRELEPAQGP